MGRESLIPLHARDGSVRANARVDDNDFDQLNASRWSLQSQTGYAVRGSGNGIVLMHRQILGLVPGDGLQGDHINRIRLDNRRSNLRVVTRAQQQQNLPSRKDGGSRFRGVSWDKTRNKWRATCQVAGRWKQLGRFDDEEEAARVISEYRRLHMPFSEDALVDGTWVEKV